MLTLATTTDPDIIRRDCIETLAELDESIADMEKTNPMDRYTAEALDMARNFRAMVAAQLKALD